MTITLFIIIITAAISIPAFNNHELRNKLIFYPKIMSSPAEWYRFITSGFLHADWQHLLFNMLTLFFLGKWVEGYFATINNPTLYVWLYLSAIVISSIPSYFKHRNNTFYSALGASGGVSAIVFSFVYLAPWQWIIVLFIPVPAILFAVLYVIYSYRMDKANIDNKGHNAHMWGSIYGFVFTFIFDPYHGQHFLYQLLHPSFNF